jgi:hypothetical protein
VGERFARLRLRHGLAPGLGGRPMPSRRENQLALAV